MNCPRPVGPALEVLTHEGPPVLRVWRQEVAVSSGTQTWHLVEAQEGAPGVVCVGVRAGMLALGRSWRLPDRREAWEFPRGFGETGESPQDSARREFREETGLTAEATDDLGWFHPDSGLLANRVHAVEVVAGDSAQHESDGELSTLIWVTPGELLAMIRDGEVHDAMTLAAFLLWCSRGRWRD